MCSQGLADNTVIAKVNNSVWDLDRPLEEDCSLQLLKFDDEEAQAVSRASSLHVTMGLCRRELVPTVAAGAQMIVINHDDGELAVIVWFGFTHT